MADRSPEDRASDWVRKRAGQARDIGVATTIPTMLAVGLIGGYFAGDWLEGRYGYDPWLSFGGLVLGGAASVRKMIMMLRDEQRRKSRRSRPGGSA
ncbi:MAG TPA: AtpZ/AtpI family protein [Candidatus Krumholzibacteria bacterium]|nr:AtpZ/AtpI family protein [Candidatus Krumholzibacteria bacterium]